MIVLLVGVALLVGIFAGCTTETTPENTAPVSAITCITTGYVGDEITFLSAAEDADGTIETYSWDLGDDDTEDGTDQNFVYTFDAEGTYTLTLTVTDDGGETHESDPCSIVITFTPPTVEITAPDTVTNGTAAQFNATVTEGAGTVGDTDYAWYIDGEMIADENTSTYTHTFDLAGDHTVKVVVTDSNTYTGEKEITVTVAEAE